MGISQDAAAVPDISGVTTTTSSVLDLVSERLLNSAPKMGICASPGTEDRF